MFQVKSQLCLFHLFFVLLIHPRTKQGKQKPLKRSAKSQHQKKGKRERNGKGESVLLFFPFSPEQHEEGLPHFVSSFFGGISIFLAKKNEGNKARNKGREATHTHTQLKQRLQTKTRIAVVRVWGLYGAPSPFSLFSFLAKTKNHNTIECLLAPFPCFKFLLACK